MTLTLRWSPDVFNEDLDLRISIIPIVWGHYKFCFSIIHWGEKEGRGGNILVRKGWNFGIFLLKTVAN